MAAPDQKVFIRDKKGGISGFDDRDDALTYARKVGGSIITGKEAADLQLEADAQGGMGALAAGAANSMFTIPKLLVGALGNEASKRYLATAEEAHPYAAFGGSFLAPWGSAGKLAGGAARGLFGLGEAAEASSIFGKGVGSIFAEGSPLEAAALHSGEPAAGMAARAAEARGLEPIMEGVTKAARPGVARELGGLAENELTKEGAAIVNAHPRSFLEAAAREGSVNAGVGAINSAGDYLLQERYMDGDPHEDAGGLTDAILHGALVGGALGSAAGVVTHGAGKALDAALNPLNAPKVKVPGVVREQMIESFMRGGKMTAEEAAQAATTAIEHGISGVGAHAESYNVVSHLLESQRFKRALERGEIQLPAAMSGEGDLADFVSNATKKAHVVRGGGELPNAATHLAGAEEDIAQALRNHKETLIGEARKPLSPEAKAVHEASAYDGHLAKASTEAELVEGGSETARLLDKADALMAKNPTSRLARLQALELLDKAEAAAPKGFTLDAERAALRGPLEHASNGQEFLSALDKHQLANKAREDVGKLVNEANAGGHMTAETVTGLEQKMKDLGLEGGRADRAMREHYENLAAQAVGKESKALSPTMQMLSGLFAGGLASKVLGGFGGGFLGGKLAQTAGQAAIDPIGASATIRKATLMLRYGAQDVDRLAQGVAPTREAKASLMNVVENVTPWGKVLWETAPGQTARLVGQTVENGFKALAPSMPQRAAAGMEIAHNIEQHLKEHEPKPIQPKDVNPAAMANLPPRYNEREVAQYQTRLQAAVDPKSTIATFLKSGEMSKEAADTLRAAHPTIVNQVVAKGAAEMAKVPEADRYAMGRKLEMLAGPNGGYFSASSTPTFTAAVQKSYMQNQPGGPGPGGPSGNASPQGKPTEGGAQYAPVSAMKPNGFLRQTNAPPSAALSTAMGGAK